MQTTITINGKPVEITLTEEQVKQITEATKPKLFEYEKGNTYFIHYDYISEKYDGETERRKNYGRYRRTKEAAEMDFKRQTRMFRLSALAWELGECKEFVPAEDNWEIDYSYSSKEYFMSSSTIIEDPTKVYMTEETARKVLEILNSGEYSLDVD
jgi:uncharacterized protein (DUF1684 family)